MANGCRIVPHFEALRAVASQSSGASNQNPSRASVPNNWDRWWVLGRSHQSVVALATLLGWVGLCLLLVAEAVRTASSEHLVWKGLASPASSSPPAAGSEAKRSTDENHPSVLLQLDLNQATAVQLMQLPGIGPVLAQRIVEYRDQHGPFESVEELLRVRGIGPRRLERLRPYLFVEPQAPDP